VDELTRIAVAAVMAEAKARGIPLPGSGMSDLGATAEEIKTMTAQAEALEQSASMFKATGMSADADKATAAAKALRDKIAAGTVVEPSWWEKVIGSVAMLAPALYAQQLLLKQQQAAAKAAATGLPSYNPVTVGQSPGFPSYAAEEPFYTKPWFLGVAALGILGGGFLLLRK